MNVLLVVGWLGLVISNVWAANGHQKPALTWLFVALLCFALGLFTS